MSRAAAPTTTTVSTGAGGHEATVALGQDAHLLSVCLGEVDDVGTVAEITRDRELALDGEVVGEVVGPLVDVSSAHGDGTRRTTRVGQILLSDHYVERDGWVHVVGYLRPEGVGDQHLPVVDAVLASWSWGGPAGR